MGRCPQPLGAEVRLAPGLGARTVWTVSLAPGRMPIAGPRHTALAHPLFLKGAFRSRAGHPLPAPPPFHAPPHSPVLLVPCTHLGRCPVPLGPVSTVLAAHCGLVTRGHLVLPSGSCFLPVLCGTRAQCGPSVGDPRPTHHCLPLCPQGGSGEPTHPAGGHGTQRGSCSSRLGTQRRRDPRPDHPGRLLLAAGAPRTDRLQVASQEPCALLGNNNIPQGLCLLCVTPARPLTTPGCRWHRLRGFANVLRLGEGQVGTHMWSVCLSVPTSCPDPPRAFTSACKGLVGNECLGPRT